MKMFIVAVDILVAENGRVFYEQEFRIMARTAEEAEAIVHNKLEMGLEPHFRIKSVVEVLDNED